MTDEAFRDTLRTSASLHNAQPDDARAFLAACHYRSGASYGDEASAAALAAEVAAFEARVRLVVPLIAIY
jgi:hypothetical protein